MHTIWYVPSAPDFDRETLIKPCHFFDSIITLKTRGRGVAEGKRVIPTEREHKVIVAGAHIPVGRCAAAVSYTLVLRERIKSRSFMRGAAESCRNGRDHSASHRGIGVLGVKLAPPVRSAMEQPSDICNVSL